MPLKVNRINSTKGSSILFHTLLAFVFVACCVKHFKRSRIESLGNHGYCTSTSKKTIKITDWNSKHLSPNNKEPGIAVLEIWFIQRLHDLQLWFIHNAFSKFIPWSLIKWALKYIQVFLEVSSSQFSERANYISAVCLTLDKWWEGDQYTRPMFSQKEVLAEFRTEAAVENNVCHLCNRHETRDWGQKGSALPGVHLPREGWRVSCIWNIEKKQTRGDMPGDELFWAADLPVKSHWNTEQRVWGNCQAG